jgi:hypothetical protein
VAQFPSGSRFKAAVAERHTLRTARGRDMAAAATVRVWHSVTYVLIRVASCRHHHGASPAVSDRLVAGKLSVAE